MYIWAKDYNTHYGDTLVHFLKHGRRANHQFKIIIKRNNHCPCITFRAKDIIIVIVLEVYLGSPRFLGCLEQLKACPWKRPVFLLLSDTILHKIRKVAVMDQEKLVTPIFVRVERIVAWTNISRHQDLHNYLPYHLLEQITINKNSCWQHYLHADTNYTCWLPTSDKLFILSTPFVLKC
jgi:hypothetical protein